MKKLIKRTLISIFCMAIVCSLVGCKYGSAYDVADSEHIILNMVMVADMHTDGNYLRDRMDILRHSFKGITASSDYDIFLCAGDITNSGTEKEYKNLKKVMKLLDADSYIFAMGNHDSWHESADPNYDLAKAGFLDLCAYTGIQTENTYYSTIKNGYHFICTGYNAGRLEHKDPYIDEEQFAWLEESLKNAMASDLPIFVVHHQPYENMNDLEAIRLEMLIDKYAEAYDKPIVVVTGHQHDLNEETFTVKESDLYYLNLPSLIYTDEEKGGTAFAVEVYESKILILGRNFVTGEWLKGQQYEINF